MAGELAQVHFHGDIIEGKSDGDRVVLPLRRLCDNFGVAMQNQLEKLKNKPWAVITEIVMDSVDECKRKVVCIDLDTLPGWLFSLNAGKVKPVFREKLALYQREAARVLADHFFRRTNDVSALLATVLTRLDALEARPAITAFVAPVAATPRFTIRQRLEWKGWKNTSKDQRKKIYKLAVAKLDARHDETPDVSGGPGGGGPCRFYGHQLSCLDEAIDEVRQIYIERDAARGPGLFKAVAA